jgi:hypothetical protein
MGAGQSIPNEIYEKQIVTLTEKLAKCVKKDGSNNCLWDNGSINGLLIFEKRHDGSSIKELYIPAWNTVFFENHGVINVRRENNTLKGKSINISEADAVLLHNLLLKQKAASEASDIAVASFFKYVGTTNDKM